MSSYLISYCIDSKEMYRSYEESTISSNVDEAFDLLDLLVEDDTIYIDLMETKDALNINGDEQGRIFLEINTAKDGVFSKLMSIGEVKLFLKSITVDFDELDAMGFQSRSI